MPQLRLSASSPEQLMEIIHAGCNLHDDGIEVALWDGQTVFAQFTQSQPNIEAPDSLLDEEEVESFVERLLDHGTPFITSTGDDDQVCILRWSILTP